MKRFIDVLFSKLNDVDMISAHFGIKISSKFLSDPNFRSGFRSSAHCFSAIIEIRFFDFGNTPARNGNFSPYFCYQRKIVQ